MRGLAGLALRSQWEAYDNEVNFDVWIQKIWPAGACVETVMMKKTLLHGLAIWLSGATVGDRLSRGVADLS